MKVVAARREMSRLANPGTAFCSWTSRVAFTLAAAMAAGPETYPPKTATTWVPAARIASVITFAALHTIPGNSRFSFDSDRRSPCISTGTKRYPAAGTASASMRSPPKKTIWSAVTPRSTRASATAMAGNTCPPVPAAAKA